MTFSSEKCQTDSGVSGCRFNDGAAGNQFSFGLGAANHSDRGAILHAATRVEVLQLGENLCRACGRELFQFEDGRLADQLGNVFSDTWNGTFDGFYRHPYRLRKASRKGQ